jgi:hypothetical protein
MLDQVRRGPIGGGIACLVGFVGMGGLAPAERCRNRSLAADPGHDDSRRTVLRDTTRFEDCGPTPAPACAPAVLAAATVRGPDPAALTGINIAPRETDYGHWQSNQRHTQRGDFFAAEEWTTPVSALRREARLAANGRRVTLARPRDHVAAVRRAHTQHD